MSDLTFTSWQRTSMYNFVTNPATVDGRLVGSLPLALIDSSQATAVSGSVPFHIVAARDIAALAARSVVHTAPAREARDAETTKLVHIDFAEADLPWRYTPRLAAGDRLPPWMVLLVGTTDELRIDGQTVKILQPQVLQAHDLADSPRWAHVQHDGQRTLSRIVSPRALEAEKEYVVALVRAFDDAGLPSWDLPAGRTAASLALLYSWRFWTAEAGDFETLAFQIMPRAAAGLGRAPLAYRRGLVNLNLEVRGAITGLGIDPDGQDEAAARADLAAFVSAVAALDDVDPLGRSVIGLPRYGRPWVADPNAASWSATLNHDPRFRGSAGLGVWMGLEAQDELVDAAVHQLGAIEHAAHLVGQLALGLLAAGSLFSRRLPPDPVRRLDVLSPLTRRMRTPNGTLADTVAGAFSPLRPALFSSASKRMLRRGAAWTRHTAGGFVARPEIIGLANRCPDPPARPSGVPHIDGFAESLGLPPLDAIGTDVLSDPPQVDPELTFDPGSFTTFIDPMLPRGEAPECHPAPLGELAGAVVEAIDPRGPNPPAKLRLRRRITGLDLTDLSPPEIPVGLDFPTWTLLRQRAKEWILPGIATLERHSVVAMQTNPTFIDAYLVGLNSQLQDELHWRNLPIDRTSTPLLMFWGHVNFETGQREAEIRPFRDWSAQSDLGDLGHQVLQPGDITGKRDLVIVFRTDLFRRYPRTLVYLAKPVPDEDAALTATPDFSFDPAQKADRRFLGPIFQGAIATDVVFFAFDVDPDTLDQYWLVLDEPPSELRFRSVDAAGNILGGAATAGADFAVATIDQPTRVGIDGTHLEELGLRL